MIIHAVNLTRGVLCPHVTHELPCGAEVRMTRIRSVQCEYELWDVVVMSLGSDLYWNLSRGHQVIVHDFSERDQETRACRQGVALIRRACETMWGLPLTVIPGDEGRGMEAYFDWVIPRLGDSTRSYLRYFQVRQPAGEVQLRSCWGWDSGYTGEDKAWLWSRRERDLAVT